MRWVTTRRETKRKRTDQPQFDAAQLVLNGNLLGDAGIDAGDLVEVEPVRRGEIRLKRVPPSDPRYKVELAKRRKRLRAFAKSV